MKNDQKGVTKDTIGCSCCEQAVALCEKCHDPFYDTGVDIVCRDDGHWHVDCVDDKSVQQVVHSHSYDCWCGGMCADDDVDGCECSSCRSINSEVQYDHRP